MKTSLTIAKYTLIEALRDKFILVVMALLLLSVIAGYFLKSLTLFGAETTAPATIIASFGFLSAAISVLYVNIATRRELDGRTMLVILSKPISDFSYISGKHLGFWFVSFLYIAFGAVVLMIAQVGSVGNILLYSISLLLMQLIVIAWSLFFALLLNSIAASIIVSFLAWGLFNSVEALFIMAKRSSEGIQLMVVQVIYYLAPSYSKFDFKTAVLHNLPITAGELLFLVGYAAVYTAIIALLAWFDFSRKEY